MTITIDNAIAQLQKEIPPIPVKEWARGAQAKALAIDALKCIKGLRTEGCYLCPPKLLMETASPEEKRE